MDRVIQISYRWFTSIGLKRLPVKPANKKKLDEIAEREIVSGIISGKKSGSMSVSIGDNNYLGDWSIKKLKTLK